MSAALPARLPLTREELLAFAALLGEQVDPDDPRSACGLGWSTMSLDDALARQLAEGARLPAKLGPKEVDVRRFQPFDPVFIVGQDSTGDLLFIDERRRSRAGTNPVVRYPHDGGLTAELEANGEYELAARALLERWAVARGTLARPDVQALLATPVVIDEP